MKDPIDPIKQKTAENSKPKKKINIPRPRGKKNGVLKAKPVGVDEEEQS